MIQTALVLLGALATHPYAVFWGAERTWVADVEAARLYVAPDWLVADGARVWRYRSRVEAERPAGDEAARRRRLLERGVVGTPTFAAVGPEPGGAPQDELVVLQFRGDAVTLGRFRRDLDRSRTEALSLRLPDLAPEPPPPVTGPALEWLARWPGLLDPCVRRPAGGFSWERGGGRVVRWLQLVPAGPACDGRAHAVAVVVEPGPAPPPDLVDRRARPDGEVALLLRGPALTDEDVVQRDLLAFTDPCADREVLLQWGDRSPVPLGRAPRLDGLRWVGAGDPLVKLLPTWFLPADDASVCTRPLTLTEGELPSAHRCRVDERGRAWGGRADLSAAVDARLERGELHLFVRVVDDARARGDAVHVFAGPRARRITVTPEGGDGAWREVPGGYEVGLVVTAAGDPPAVSVRVDDADPDVPGEVSLWAAGHRTGGAWPRPAPVEAP